MEIIPQSIVEEQLEPILASRPMEEEELQQLVVEEPMSNEEEFLQELFEERPVCSIIPQRPRSRTKTMMKQKGKVHV